MQLDHAAGNTVIEAACNGADYQSWQAIVVGGGWGFKSEYNSQCLTYNKGAGWLDTVPCVNQWYQEFYAY